MRAIVTGGAGFLGWHLVDTLQRRGYDVLIIDSGITSDRASQALPLKEGVYFRHEDVGDIKDWVDLLTNTDELYWLSSPASPPDYMNYSRETFTANVVGLYNAIAAIESYGLKTRILFASTSEIYGDPLEHPQKETYFGNVNTLGPRSIYDESKRMGETLLYTFSKNFVIARIFNTYGPGMRKSDGRLVTEAMSAAKDDRALEVFGTGEQTRSLCYVYDTIAGLLTLMEKGQHGEAYNVGNELEVSVNMIIDEIASIAGRRIAIQPRPDRHNDPLRRRPDISKIKALGWEPTTALRNGLTKMWEEDYADK